MVTLYNGKLTIYLYTYLCIILLGINSVPLFLVVM